MDNLRKAIRTEKEARENDEQAEQQEPKERFTTRDFDFDDFCEHIIQHLEKPTTLIPVSRIDRVKENLIRDRDVIIDNFKAIEHAHKETKEAKNKYMLTKRKNDEMIARSYQQLEPVFQYLNCWRSPTGKQIVGRGVYPIFESEE